MTLDIPVAGTSIDPGLFSGKRRAPRTLRALDVRCGGASGLVVTGRTVDVSRGGMLLELRDPKFAVPTDASHLVAFATRLGTSFPVGLDVRFDGGSVRARATIVRLVANPTGATAILLGCRFDPPLTDVDCALVGLDNEGDETSKPAAAAPPAADGSTSPSARPGTKKASRRSGRDDLLAFIEQGCDTWSGATPSVDAVDDCVPLEQLLHEHDREVVHFSEPSDDDTVAYVFPVGAPHLGSHARGRVVELHTRAVTVDLPAPAGESDAVEWAAHFGGEVRLVCLRDGQVLWEARAKVRRLRHAGPGEVRFVLIADSAPPPASRLALGRLAAV